MFINQTAESPHVFAKALSKRVRKESTDLLVREFILEAELYEII